MTDHDVELRRLAFRAATGRRRALCSAWPPPESFCGLTAHPDMGPVLFAYGRSFELPSVFVRGSSSHAPECARTLMLASVPVGDPGPVAGLSCGDRL